MVTKFCPKNQLSVEERKVKLRELLFVVEDQITTCQNDRLARGIVPASVEIPRARWGNPPPENIPPVEGVVYPEQRVRSLECLGRCNSGFP